MQVTDNSDKVMICSTTIPSTSKKMKNLLVNESLHSSYIQKKITDKNDMIINIFSSYIEPLIKEINYPELLQEWKLNLDSTDYKQNIDANLYKLPEKKIQSS